MTARNAAKTTHAATPLRAPRGAAAPRITLSDAQLPSIDIKDALWEGRGTIITTLLIALLLAGLYVGVLATPVYEATARIRLVLAPGPEALPVEQAAGIAGRKIELETELAAITSAAVMDPVAANLPEPLSANELVNQLRVRALPGALVIEIAGQAESAARAADLTNAVVTTYLAAQVDAKVALREARTAALAAQLQTQTEELQAVEAQLAAALAKLVSQSRRDAEARQLRALRIRANRMRGWPVLSDAQQRQITDLDAAADRLSDSLSTAENQALVVSEIRAERDALAQATDITRSQLHQMNARAGTEEPDAIRLTEAIPPDRAIAPQKGLVFGIATLAGLAVGASWALSRGLRRGGLRLPETIEALTGLPVLTEVPETPGRLPRHLDASPKTPFRAAFARLKLAVLASGMTRQIILMTGPAPEDGKGWVALGLAQALGENRRILVIDADMHRPNLATHLHGTPPAHGLAAHILGLVEEAEVIREEPDFGFDLVAGEMLDGDPETLIASREFAGFLERMRKRYDIILVNAPPLLASTDARLLAAHCDATLICARWDRTRAKDLREALRVVELEKTPVLGVILTRRAVDPTPKFSGYTRWRDATQDQASSSAVQPET